MLHVEKLRAYRILRADRDEANTSGATEHACQKRSRTHHRRSRVRSDRSEDREEHISSESICRQSVRRCA